MALIPGILSQQTVLTDGAQVPSGKTLNANVVTETTTGNGVQIQGRTNGTAIEAGKVGEMALGGAVLRSGTGGYSYSIRSTTPITATDSVVVSATLNKGVYLVMGRVRCYSASATTYLSAAIRVGGTIITDTGSVVTSTVTVGVSIEAPIVVTADGTIVAISSAIGSGGVPAGGNNHEMFIVRIA